MVDEQWFAAFAEACALHDEASIVAAAQELLGAEGLVATWRPGRAGWTPEAAPEDLEVPADVPAPGEVVVEGTRAILRIGNDPTAARLLVMAAPRLAPSQVAPVARLLGVALDRVVAHEVAAYTRRRLDDNERIGQLGSYDWHVPTDTNRWSDQLYRIYGEEPQSFNASYERFMDYIHPDDRDHVRGIHEQAFATGEPYEMEERIVLRDGTERLLWSNGEVIPGPNGAPERFIGICRDVTDQRRAEVAAEQAEHHRQLAHDAEIRRKAALELNDAVVQGLSAAAFAHDVGAHEVAGGLLQGTLERARRVMDDLLESPEGPPDAGWLRRSNPPESQLTPEHSTLLNEHVGGPPKADEGAPSGKALRVIVADDSADLRELIELQLQALGFDVIGVCEDGLQAVDLTTALEPDAVVLDLSMPVMDGLEAAERIRASQPGTRIVILSGYAASTMSEPCLAAGADAYVEKGGSLGDRLAEAIGAPSRA